ncbi:MAG: putative toxin-antitoxin system toxin component, PIN family [bacterium]
MIVIVDTNVLVSVVLGGKKPVAMIDFILSRQDIIWAVSNEILLEYYDVLHRPRLRIPEIIRSQWITILSKDTTNYKVTIDYDFPRDQSDAKFLALALTVDADFFITGDKDFSDAQILTPTTIVSVAQFFDLSSNGI